MLICQNAHMPKCSFAKKLILNGQLKKPLWTNDNCDTAHTKLEGQFGLNGPFCFYTSIVLQIKAVRFTYWTSFYIFNQTVRDTLKDANEINEYKAKELNEKVKNSLKKYFLLV